MENIKWEIFYDDSFYGLWAVRPIGDTEFNSPRLFHFQLIDDAERFKKLVEKAYIAIPKP